MSNNMTCKNLAKTSMLICCVRTWLSCTFSNALMIYIHVFSGPDSFNFSSACKLHSENVLKILGRSNIATIDVTANLSLIWDKYTVVFTQLRMNHFIFYEGYLHDVNFPLAVVFIVFGLYTVLANTFKNLRRTLYICYVLNLKFANILVRIDVEPLNVSVYRTKTNPAALLAFYLFAVLSCVSSILITYPLWCLIATSLSDRRDVTSIRASVVFLWLVRVPFFAVGVPGMARGIL